MQIKRAQKASRWNTGLEPSCILASYVAAASQTLSTRFLSIWDNIVITIRLNISVGGTQWTNNSYKWTRIDFIVSGVREFLRSTSQSSSVYLSHSGTMFWTEDPVFCIDSISRRLIALLRLPLLSFAMSWSWDSSIENCSSEAICPTTERIWSAGMRGVLITRQRERTGSIIWEREYLPQHINYLVKYIKEYFS